MALQKKNLVEKRNVLNEIRRNNMTLQEMRFFSIYLSKINARDTSTRLVRFPLEDFRRIMEFGRLNITQLKATTNSLLGKVVNVPNDRGGYTGFQLFKECTVDKDEFEQWYVEIDAHDKALPLMFDFKRDYFTYELWNALRLKSSNQLRMYELLKQYEKVGERRILLTELKQFLGLAVDDYPRWDNFKRRILDSCQEALLETTDICFEYTPIKAGRKITGVHFTIKKNDDYIDQMTLDEFIELQKVDEDEDEPFEDVPEVNDPLSMSIVALPPELTREQIELLRELALPHMPDDVYTINDKEMWLYHYFTAKVKLMKSTPNVKTPWNWLKGAVAGNWQ